MSREDRSARGSSRWWWALAVVPLLSVGAWVAAHHVREPGAPPYSEADLPALVEPSANGVPEARALGASLAPGLPEDIRAWVTGDEPSASWERATERLLTLRELVEPHRDALDAIDARPRFRDDCEPRAEAVCDVISLLRAHELASLDALARVAELPPYDDDAPGFDAEVWAAADARAARLVERSRDFASAPRLLLATMAASVLFERSVLGAGPLVHGARAVGAPLPRLEAALREPFPAPALRAAAIGELLLARRALEEIPLGFFGDRARTAAEIDDYFVGVVTHLDDPSAPMPSFVPHEDRFGWWLYDPGGKAFIDAMLIDMDGVLRRAEDGARRAEEARRALHDVLGRQSAEP
ncbi:MAG: hypothetical protein KF901_22255 [Myxococcales bacterium]|nr:hypothetical protein [Myxococcales bacterium]